VTADQRVEIAHDYLASVRRHKVTALPPSVLVRECAELRRQLGQVLDLISEQVALTPAQLATALKALTAAAEHAEVQAGEFCDGCGLHPAGVCDKHADLLDEAGEYHDLERVLTSQATRKPAGGAR
jgi:hypothetical protein